MITCNILFSGIGAQEAALKRLGLDFKVIGISEIDKYAIQSYEAINGPTRNYGDITQIERLDYADLWTYSSPCQDFSTAGKQKGIYNADGSLTRSGLLKHVERLLTDSVLYGTQPKYLLMENVKGLVSKKFKPDFNNWLDKLKQLGYNNYWQVLNAKDYGIPQNRERVFVVSIRKDIDTKGYKFPSPIPLKLRLKDKLEPVVDEKYYLSDDKVAKFVNALNKKIENQDVSYCIDANYWKGTTPQQFLNKTRRQLVKEVSNTIRCGGGGSLDGKHTRDIVVEPLCAASRGRNPENPSDRTAGNQTEQRFEINNTGCSNTLTSVQKDNYVVEPKVIQVGNIYTSKGQNGNVYSCKGVCPTILSGQGIKGNGIGSNNAPKIIQVGNIVSTGNWDNPQRGRIYSSEGCSPALNTMQGGGLKPKILEQLGGAGLDIDDPFWDTTEESVEEYINSFKDRIEPIELGYRIRKLTPRECWRLMAFTDIEFDCAKLSGVSDSRLYQQAGNSIVVDVLVGIFKELFDDRF